MSAFRVAFSEAVWKPATQTRRPARLRLPPTNTPPGRISSPPRPRPRSWAPTGGTKPSSGRTACASSMRAPGRRQRRTATTGSARPARPPTLAGGGVCALLCRAVYLFLPSGLVWPFPSCTRPPCRTRPPARPPFRRRLQCYQCGRGRTPGARPVPAEEPPSCILRVGGLQQATDEETLRFAFVPHAPGGWVAGSVCEGLGLEAAAGPGPCRLSSTAAGAPQHALYATTTHSACLFKNQIAVRDIRLVRDRHTGELRGVAYVQFYRWGLRGLSGCGGACGSVQCKLRVASWVWAGCAGR